MASDLLRELLQAAIAASVAIVVLLCVRRPLRTRFGAHAAYRAWLLVPLAIVGVWLPASSAPAPVATGGLVAGIAPAGWIAGATVATSAQGARLALSLWAAGVVLVAAWFAMRQWRFERLVERRPGRRLARAPGQGPALVGWWRSRIVLPEDFRARYTVGERRLVLAHEVAHLRRGDIHAQALATGLRCVFWFDPLFHLAADAFRFDQELACDATVLARFPRGRARYGSAMLKTQLAGFGLPVGCHWPSSHPLKERIEMLKHPLPARARKLSGAALVATMMSIGTFAAWAAQPASPATAPAAAPLISITDDDDLTAPAFPIAALNTDGKVVLELLVGVDGKVKDVKVISSEPAGVFDQVSIEAARKWRIAPAMENGVPVEHRVQVPISYRSHRDDADPLPAAGASPQH